jgi:uncharacterized protein YheU (UPF0270 family)
MPTYHYEPIEAAEGPGSEGAPHTEPVEIPYEQLAADVLRSLVESFIHREGTDYGLRESTLEQKVADVMRQLENGEAVITFDAEDESVTIVPTSGS